jgi:hypothetical protein
LFNAVTSPAHITTDATSKVMQTVPDCLRIAWVGAMLALALPCAAQQVRVTGGDCGEPVHVVAQEAPLSSVLKRLADAARFKLAYRSDDDPLITADERLPLTELVRKLARDVNFTIEQRSDAGCARVAAVSVLPDGTDSSRPPNPKKAAWQTPEYDRIAKQELSDYLRSHGLKDQPLEEIAIH